MVNRVTIKLIIRYCPIKNRYQFIWAHKIKFCKWNFFYCGPLNRGLRLWRRRKRQRKQRRHTYPGWCGGGCQIDVAWWTNTLLLLIAKRIRCQKACNRLATHPLAKVLSTKASTVTGRGNIQERMSSCSQEMLSPSTKIATPETPSADAFKRRQQGPMGITQRRQLDSIQGEGVDSKRWERNV